eukprot:UN24438
MQLGLILNLFISVEIYKSRPLQKKFSKFEKYVACEKTHKILGKFVEKNLK